MDMDNLFGSEFDHDENGCATTNPVIKKSKKTGTTTAPATPKMGEDTPLEARLVQVKVYNDFYHYEAPEDLETPKVGDVRKWLVARGFSELTVERAQFVWIKTDDIAEKFLFAGVKFEKQG